MCEANIKLQSIIIETYNKLQKLERRVEKNDVLLSISFQKQYTVHLAYGTNKSIELFMSEKLSLKIDSTIYLNIPEYRTKIFLSPLNSEELCLFSNNFSSLKSNLDQVTSSCLSNISSYNKENDICKSNQQSKTGFGIGKNSKSTLTMINANKVFVSPRKTSNLSSLVMSSCVNITTSESPKAKRISIKTTPKKLFNVKTNEILIQPSPTRKSPSTPCRSDLSEEQENVLRICNNDDDDDGGNNNVFFTGSAGTGKTFLLSIIIQKLAAKYGSQYTFVTATTGLAACALNGTTLHQFAGLTIFDEDEPNIIKSVIDRVI
jgi:Cdc6-like AAA superfamily ATPase